MTFLELAEKILRETKKPMAPNKIWEFAEINNYIDELGSGGKSPWKTLGAVLYVDVRDKIDSKFISIGRRPKNFYLKEYDEIIDKEKYELDDGEETLVPINKSNYKEKDLHAFLAHFAFYHLKAYTKTISHLKTKGKGYLEWLHPDMVGCYFSQEDWNDEVFELSSSIGNNVIKLFSFELKKELNLKKLRESFFQTVSNSSWAHESYLVAAEISKNEDFINELTRLSKAFGIGVIKLDIEDPFSSEIILTPKRREELDWDTINKLTMNQDFKNFLKRIITDLKIREIRKEKYEKILSDDELIKSINKKTKKI